MWRALNRIMGIAFFLAGLVAMAATLFFALPTWLLFRLAADCYHGRERKA